MHGTRNEICADTLNLAFNYFKANCVPSYFLDVTGQCFAMDWAFASELSLSSPSFAIGGDEGRLWFDAAPKQLNIITGKYKVVSICFVIYRAKLMGPFWG